MKLPHKLQIMRIGFATAWAILLIGAIPTAFAQVYSYSTNSRQVKVGVVMPLSWRRSYSPNLLYVLDQRADLKPSGWDLVNPLAPERVDDNLAKTWNNSGNATPSTRTTSDPYVTGDTLSKSMAGYWDVPLNTTSTEQLAEFDLLYLAPPQAGLGLHLQTDERDKLRKAVDSGAVLWVERPNGVNFKDFQLFISLTFNSASSSIGSVTVSQPRNPVLNSPYVIGQSDLNSLFGQIGQYDIGKTLLSSMDPIAISTLLQDQAGKTIAAVGQYGSGYIVMTDNVGKTINNSVKKGTTTLWLSNNLGGYSGTDFTQVPVSALKFAYNVIAANQESAQERRTPRHNASLAEQDGAPLTRKWTFPDGTTDPTTGASWKSGSLYSPTAAPAVYKGVVVVPAANGHLYAFDLDPMSDLDGDGNPDDGWGSNGPLARPYDLSNGAPYDMLWDYDLGSKIGDQKKIISTPTIATVNDPTRGVIDVVYVSTSDGKMYAFQLFPKTGNHLSGSPSLYWKQPASLGDSYIIPSTQPLRIPAPVFGEQRLFAAAMKNTEGKIIELNPYTGAEIWHYVRSDKPLASVPPSIGVIMGTPTLAWVSDDATSAKDLVLYVPSFSEASQGQTGRIFAFLLSVRGEHLTDSGDHKQFRSRYWLAPTNLPWGQNYIINTATGITGSPVSGKPGWVELSTAVATGTTVTADYDLDMSADNYKPRSTFYAFPGNNGQYPDFIASPVVGPDDTLYAVAVDSSRNLSSLYAFKDQSPIAYVQWRYTLPDKTLVLGSPAFYNGAVYVGTDQGKIIGFDANPTFYVDVSGVLDESRKFQINLVQDDPTLPKAFQTIAFTYNQAQFDAANITDVDSVTRQTRVHLRINIKNFSLSGSTSLDASLPIRVRFPTAGQSAQAEETSEIKATTSLCGDTSLLFTGASGKNANKLFDLSLPSGSGGNSIASGPTVAGDTIYVATNDGNIYAFPDDPCALAGAGQFGSSAKPILGAIPAPTTLMVKDAATNPAILSPIVISAGNLIANTAGGVLVFQQPVTLVADANRILETRNSYDSAKNLVGSEIVWSLSATTRYNASPSPGKGVIPAFNGTLPQPERISLEHPASVTRLSNTNFLIADTGNNRVVEVDRSGSVLWELTSFADPYNILGGAEPLTLNTPTDVQRWTTYSSTGATEMHTLVVDNGNHRLLEIRDTFVRNSSQGSPEYHVLAWASDTNLPNSYYDYRDAQRIPGGIPGLPSGEYVVATVSNWRVNSIDGSVADTPGGSLVILNGIETNSQGQVTNRKGQLAAFARDITLPDNSVRAINNPTSFQRFYTGSGATDWRGLLTDGLGFYELSGSLNTTTREITMSMTSGVDGQSNAQAKGIVLAKRLASGNTLVVNQALNQVFEFQKGLGFIPLSPSTSGTYSLAQPASADRTF